MRQAWRRGIGVLLGILTPALALAHAGHCGGGFGAGLAHPFSGIDHLLAMAAVGWWAAVTQQRQWWTVPLSFAAMTLAGALLGLSGALSLPAGETAIALSLVLLGVLLWSKRRLPLPAACAVAAACALFHGYAHGLEMPACDLGEGWLAGMVAATALLHLGGAALGRFAARHADWATRLAGGATALTGVALLSGLLSA